MTTIPKPKDDFAGASPDINAPWAIKDNYILDRFGRVVMKLSRHSNDPSGDIQIWKTVARSVNAFSPDRDAKLREALKSAYSHLMNLQPTIANVIISEHRPFIDNKVNPAMQQIETALALLPEEA